MGRLLNISIALLIQSLVHHQSAAFAPSTSSQLSHYSAAPSSITFTSHHAPKSMSSLLQLSAKRRRRKDAPSQPSTSDELPDFDLEEDVTVELSTQTKVEQPQVTKSASTPQPKPVKPTNPTPIARGSGLSSSLASDLGGNVDGLDEDLILSAMRGKGEGSWTPPTSIEDTLRDRSLEKYMNFERQIALDGSEANVVELPTMEEVINRRKKREAEEEGRMEEASNSRLIDTDGMGKKAAKRAERKAAAVQREEMMENNDGGFSLEGLNILKLMENGAWVGIGLLVLWEIYINSPFFERAAPLIPAVFD